MNATAGLDVRPITAGFAAEVDGVDLSRPLLEPAFQKISDALDRYGVLAFHDQPLDDQQLLALAPRFGPLDAVYPSQLRTDIQQRLKNPEFTDIGNLAADGGIAGPDDVRRAYLQANLLWHTDTTYKPIPTRVTLLHARIVPPVGADTEFADMRAAWDALPPALQARVDGLMGEHSLLHSRRKTGFDSFSEAIRTRYPPARHPLVRTHPRTGRRSLYLSHHLGRITGMADDEATELLQQLTDFATQRRFVHAHRWRVGDLLVWDDSFTMHRATPFDDATHPRELRRLGVNEPSTTVDEAFSVVRDAA